MIDDYNLYFVKYDEFVESYPSKSIVNFPIIY